MSSNNGHKKRSYSDREKAAALAAIVAYGDLKSASEAMNIPLRTLYAWAGTEEGETQGIPDNKAEFAETCQLAKRDLAAKMEEVAHLYAARAAESDAVAGTSGYYAVQAVQKSAETFRLLREQSTVIVDDKGRIESAVARVIERTGCDRLIAEQAVLAQPEFRELGKIG